jgi:dienelactone hydrolase
MPVALIVSVLLAPAALGDLLPMTYASVLNTSALTARPPASPQGLGPYRVGRSTFAYVDTTRENRLMVMDAWYPVTQDDAAGVEPSSYDLVFAGLESPVALANPVIADDEPFPLLVFSHGSLGIRFQSFFLTEALASHGFIVVAVDHAGNTAQDLVFDTLEPFELNAVNRPQDVSFTITTMLGRNAAANDPFFGRIDAQRIGVLGHSFGGYTALATASGIDGVAADTRVIALAPFAPASSILTDAQLQSITVPTLILGGTADITTPVDNQSSRPFELLSSPERTRIDLIDAGHQSFTNICILSETLLDAGIDMDLVAFLLGNAAEGCAPDLMPIETAHDLSIVYIVSFMKTFVTGDPRYAKYLTPAFTASKQLPATVYVP